MSDSKLIEAHLPCKDCGSSDALSTYSDHTYCHSCGEYHASSSGDYVAARPVDSVSSTPRSSSLKGVPEEGFKECRGISAKTMERFGVWNQGNEQYYPYYSPDGTHVANKIRTLDTKGFMSQGNIQKTGLFGQQLFPIGGKFLTVTEGELDALSAYEMFGSKYPCVSVKSSTTAEKDISDNWEYCNSYETIVLVFDNDKPHRKPDGSVHYPGQDAAKRVAALFALGKVRIVTLAKGKDANDYIQQGWTRDFQHEWWSAPTFTPAGLRLAKNLWDEVSEPKNYETQPYPWDGLNDLTYGIRLSEMVTITAQSGIGKALALDTDIPTPSGWATMGALRVGDEIFDDTGSPCRVTFVTPVQLDRECYKVFFSDGSEIVCDKDHNWMTSTKSERDNSSPPQIRTTEQILQTLRVNGNNQANHSIPCVSLLGLPDEILSIPPYVLGAWLGDGSSNGQYVWSNDDQIIEEISKSGYKTEKVAAKLGYKVVGLRGELKDLDLIGNKHIPEEYLRGSHEQRLALLQGLMDTDGYCSSTQVCEFSVVNKRLAEDVLELVLSLGIKATMKTGEAKLYGRVVSARYRITFTTRQLVFRLQRKLDRLPYRPETGRTRVRYIIDIQKVESVPVRCIQVDSPSHLYLCGRQFIITHNTSIIKAIESSLRSTAPDAGIGLLHLEESNGDTLLGLMSLTAHKPLHLPDVRAEVSKEELRKYYDETCNTDKIVLWDHFGSNEIDQVLNTVRHMAALGCKYIFLDHLSIIVSDQQGDERKQLDEISTKLKTLCMELNIAVICIIHQNRQGEIRGTAGVEQLSNMVFKLFRDKEDADEWRRNVTKVTVVKNRFCGQTGPATYLWYDSSTAQLVELSKEQIARYESGAAGDLQQFDNWSPPT